MKGFILLILILLTSCSYQEKEFLSNNNKSSSTTNKEILKETSSKVSEKKVYKAWLGTYWGMSSEQLKNLFPVKEKEYDYYCPEGYELKDCKRYELKKQKIGNELYDVSFNFIKNKLANLRFVCNPIPDEGGIQYYKIGHCASEMEFLLTEKYGIPSDDNIKNTSGKGSEMGFDYNQEIVKKNWLTEEKLIKYYYVDCRGECSGIPGEKLLGYRKISVSYTPNSKIFKVDSDVYHSAKDKI